MNIWGLLENESIITLILYTIVSLIAICVNKYITQTAINKANELSIKNLKFLEEKGKNQARIEDLEKLTKIVEDVKAEISHLTNRKNLLFQEQKEALIDFQKNFTIYVNSTYFSIEAIKAINKEFIYEFLYQMNSNRNSLFVSFHRLKISFNNIELHKQMQELIDSTNEIFTLTRNYMLTFQATFESMSTGIIHSKEDEGVHILNGCFFLYEIMIKAIRGDKEMIEKMWRYYFDRYNKNKEIINEKQNRFSINAYAHLFSE